MNCKSTRGVGTFCTIFYFVMSCCTKISEFLGLGTFPSLHTTYIKLYPDLVPGILAFYNPGIFLSRRFWSRDLTPIKECVMIRYLLGPIYFYHTLEKKYATHLDICIDYDLWWLGITEMQPMSISYSFYLIYDDFCICCMMWNYGRSLYAALLINS